MYATERRLLDHLSEAKMLPLGARVGVAVSGGADSIALLRLLHALREKLGVTLAVLHFDHSLRGAASDADEEFVSLLSGELGLPYFAERADVAAAARQNRWNIEDAARRLRYAFFDRAVRENLVTHVAVAHTADDQAETVLARVLRGTGPAGLASIHPASGPIVRPLLDFRRTELREYLHAIQQSWREDATNADTTRQRASIRHALLPLLEANFSPSVVERLARLADLAREENQFWDALVGERLRALAIIEKGSIAIPAVALLAPLPSLGAAPAAQRSLTERLIRRAYGDLRRGHTAPGELSSVHVGQVIKLASESQSGTRLLLPGGVRVEKTFGEIHFSFTPASSRQPRSKRGDPVATAAASLAYQYRVALPQSGSVTIFVPEVHMSLCLKLVDWSLAERDTRSGVLDAAQLHSPLLLRNWQYGDAYQPERRRHARKLKEMLREARVPSRERMGWPVLESAGEIVWARGLPPADRFCARENTRIGVVIEEAAL